MVMSKWSDVAGVYAICVVVYSIYWSAFSWVCMACTTGICMICYGDLLPGEDIEIAPCGFEAVSYHSVCLCKLEEAQFSELCIGNEELYFRLNAESVPNSSVWVVDKVRRFCSIYRCPHCNKSVDRLSNNAVVFCGNHPMKSVCVSKMLSRVKRSISNHWCYLLPLYICSWLTKTLHRFSSSCSTYGVFHSPLFCTRGSGLLRSKQKERFVLRHIVSCVVGLLHSCVKSDVGVRVLNNVCGDAFRKFIVCRSGCTECGLQHHDGLDQQYEIGVELRRVSSFGTRQQCVVHDGYELSVMKRRMCRRSFLSALDV